MDGDALRDDQWDRLEELVLAPGFFQAVASPCSR
jgi:hypothetical protein